MAVTLRGIDNEVGALGRVVVVNTRIGLWRLDGENRATAMRHQEVVSERRIEDAVVSDPDLLGLDVLIIGRQEITSADKELDLLAIDANARLVVIENKRHQTAPDVVAQTLDYTSWAQTLELDDLAQIFAGYHRRCGDYDEDLGEAFQARFGKPLEELSPALR